MYEERTTYEDGRRVVHYEFCGYTRITVDENNYDGKIEETIEDPDTLLNKEEAPVTKVFGFIPIDKRKLQASLQKQKAYEKSYKGQLELYRKEVFQHLRWIMLKRLGAFLLSLLTCFLVSVFLTDMGEGNPQKTTNYTIILTIAMTALIIFVQINSKKEKKYNEEKARNKSILEDWESKFVTK